MYTGDICFYIFIDGKVRILRDVKCVCEMFLKGSKAKRKLRMQKCRLIELQAIEVWVRLKERGLIKILMIAYEILNIKLEFK